MKVAGRASFLLFCIFMLRPVYFHSINSSFEKSSRIDSLRDKEKINMGNPVCVVKNVIPRRGYILLTFEDEKQCIYDFLPDLSRPIFRKHQLKGREIIVMEGARSDGQWIIVE